MRALFRTTLEHLEERRVPATDLTSVASAITHSGEAQAALIWQSYEQILHRSPEPAALTYWTARLNQGLGEAGLEGALAGSSEDVHRSGGGSAWLQSLYQDLLGRPADSVGLHAWEAALAAGSLPAQIAQAFAVSPERANLRIGRMYLDYLHRLASSDEVRLWAGKLLAGADPRDVAVGFLTSSEYRGRFGSDNAWLAGVYQDVLGRPAAESEIRYWLGGDMGPGGFIRGQPAVLGPGDAQAADWNDVIQNQSPSCFLAAALAAVAESGVDLAARIRYLGGNSYDVPIATPLVNASYQVTGFGPVVHEIVDFDGSLDPATDLGLSPEGDFWPILYQRAYFQVYGQSGSGVTAFAVMALTGQPNVSVPGANWAFGAKTPQGPADLATISAALAAGHPVIADTLAGSGSILDPRFGLIASHSYAVIAADAGGLTLYNPWGVDTDWRLLDTNHDGQLSAAEAQHSPDGRDGNLFDGLVRVPLATFVADFGAYVAAAA